jgi:hypothetical protein
MSNPRKPVRGKSEPARARSGDSLSEQPSKPKSSTHSGGKPPKRKTVAAEIGATVMREETANLPPIPAERPSPRQAPKPVATKPAAPKPVIAKPAQPAAKPVPAAARTAPAATVQPTATETPKAPQPLESAANMLGRSFRAAGEGTVAVNCKLLDFARANVNSGFDHVRDLAAARSPLRIMRLQMEFWHDCLETFASQAQELRALSSALVANANEPIREQLRRGVQATAAQGRPSRN